MPCDSSYMEANGKEKELSIVACLLDELDEKPIPEKGWWQGYHPRVYGNTGIGDKLVSELCSRLRDVDVTKYSLEMQIWWRDHQEADKKRLEREILDKKLESERAAAIAKLTDYERKLLGL